MNTEHGRLKLSEGDLSAVHIPLSNQLVYTNTEDVQKILENSYKNKLCNALILTVRYYV